MTSTDGRSATAAFAAPIALTGPTRQPRQMLADQSYGGHVSLHDSATADDLGLAGAPIEGPTHFSQFDPLAFACWGQQWFETGCVSAHFRTMVIEGEEVTAGLVTSGGTSARIEATKADGSQVLSGTASLDRRVPTELDGRLAKLGDPGELFIVDQLSVGQRSPSTVTAAVDMDLPNGDLYPFSLRQKLGAITEPSDWYTTADNPWGRPILPFEMISVLAEKSGSEFKVRGPAIGLFLDLEIRLERGPLFVGQNYAVDREVIGLGQSRRTRVLLGAHHPDRRRRGRPGRHRRAALWRLQGVLRRLPARPAVGLRLEVLTGRARGGRARRARVRQPHRCPWLRPSPGAGRRAVGR